nr:hypothetical protein [Tanacetum cinerariifolium]
IVPPKVARKFKKASPSKKDSVPLPADEEPIQKGKRVKRSAKKSSTTPTIGIVIKEPPVETRSKRKEKMDVARGKGIDLLSEVALTKEAQMKEVTKKSLRDFYKSHPSGSGLVAEKPPSVEKITPPVISEGTGDKPRVPDMTKYESKNKSDDDEPPSNSEKGSDSEQGTDGSELDSESNQQDDDNEVKDDDEVEDNDDDKSKGDEDRGMGSDDVQDIKADNTKVPVTISSRSPDLASKFLKNLDIPPGDTEIISLLDVHVHHEVPRIHTFTLLVIPVSSTPSLLPTTKTTNIPPLILDFSSVFRFNDRVIALEKDVAELKNDPLHTQVTMLVDDHLDTRMGATRKEFMNFLSASLTDRITEQVRNQLPQILPDEVSNFALPVIENMIQESLNQVNLEKASSQPQSTYEAAATLTEFELKKILIDKINSSESYLTALEHQECYDAEMTRIKFKVGDTDTPQGQEGNQGNDNDEPMTKTYSRRAWFPKRLRPQEPTDPDWNEDKTLHKGPTQNWLKTLAALLLLVNRPAFRLLKGTRSNYAELEYDFEECYKPLLEKLDWENPDGSDYLFDLSKPLPLITRGNHQSVPVEFFINNDLKYLKGGILTMTYTTSTTKTKAAQYDLPGIK